MTAAFLLAALLPSCHALHSDEIRGRDLAEAVPELAALPPDIGIGLAPLPGRERTFTEAELKRIAEKNHLTADFSSSPVCFGWQMSPLSKERAMTAMKHNLEDREARILIDEMSAGDVPEGEIDFAINSLSKAYGDAPATWRGFVRYAPHRQFAIWARVRITVKEKRVFANADLHPGDIVEADQVHTETYDGPLASQQFVRDGGALAGLIVRRTIARGSALEENMFEAPFEVLRGEIVNAIVENGGARLQLQGVAEDRGHTGQVITVRNPRSGRSFRARIQEKGTVLLVPGGQYGLVPEEKKS